MLPPPNCCIQVAPHHINCATHCFDTSESRFGNAEFWVRSCTFGGQQAQTATLIKDRVTATDVSVFACMSNCCLRVVTPKTENGKPVQEEC